MAKTALLAQNDNLAIENLKQKVGRSVFDLSHTTTFPIDVDGAILPICCIETVPSDSFDISVECLLRQLSPLAVPLMTRFKLNTAFFYCDNRLAWKKWDRFMTGGRSGNEVYDIPRMANNYLKVADPLVIDYMTDDYDKIRQSYSNQLHTYFGISSGLTIDYSEGAYHLYNHGDEIDIDNASFLSDYCPVAFPFFDYQIICRDFYTDPDRLASSPISPSVFGDSPYSDWTYSNLFPVDDDEIRLVDGIQLKSGYHTGDDLHPDTDFNGFYLDKVRYHNVRDDYFTSSKKAPMRGDVPTVDTTVSVSSFDWSDVFKQDIPDSQYNELNGSDNAVVFAYKGSGTQLGKLAAGSLGASSGSYGASGATTGTQLLVNALTRLKVNIETTKAINAADLRLLSQLTVWQELNMLHKPYYNDFLNAHFDNVKVGDSAVEKPQYIGGTSQIININEVLQTSASTETSALGTQAAVASSLASNHVGSVYCNNYGYIIGVAYIVPDLYYDPALPRGFSRRTKEDYYSPEFANLSMQAILNKEMFVSKDDDWNNTPWGYTGSFDELRSIPNRIAGELLNDNYADLQAWVLRRKFDNDNLPSMSTEFLSLKDNVDKTAWKVPSMPSFILQCANYVKAVRPMPYVAIPKAL